MTMISFRVYPATANKYYKLLLPNKTGKTALKLIRSCFENQNKSHPDNSSESDHELFTGSNTAEVSEDSGSSSRSSASSVTLAEPSRSSVALAEPSLPSEERHDFRPSNNKFSMDEIAFIKESLDALIKGEPMRL